MRYTLVDERGSVSFVGPCQGLTAFVAACAEGTARTVTDLLTAAGMYDDELSEIALYGLRIFDEHNLPGNYGAIHTALAGDGARHPDSPAFRVVDDLTREASLSPVKAGLVLFNLRERCIVQLQNTYAEVMREGRGRIRQNGRPTVLTYAYRLPSEWRILP